MAGASVLARIDEIRSTVDTLTTRRRVLRRNVGVGVTSARAGRLLLREQAMRGVITRKEVLANALLIIRLWGVRSWVRCVRAALSSTPSTFLEVVTSQRDLE